MTNLYIVRTGSNSVCAGYVLATSMQDAEDKWALERGEGEYMISKIAEPPVGLPKPQLSEDERIVSTSLLLDAITALKPHSPVSKSYRAHTLQRLRQALDGHQRFTITIRGGETVVNQVLDRLRSYVYPPVDIKPAPYPQENDR